MVHTFKFGGQRIAYDSVSGLVLTITELAYKMLEYIELPMASECSSALRYDLAKYDSGAISATYDELYALYRDGKLFAEGDECVANTVCTGAAIKIGDTVCTRVSGGIHDVLISLADAGKNVDISIITAPNDSCPYTDADVPGLLKELEHIAKTQVKRKRTGEGMAFDAFPERIACSHDCDLCRGCWAVKLCTLAEAQTVMCELEQKRIECTMMVNTAE